MKKICTALSLRRGLLGLSLCLSSTSLAAPPAQSPKNPQPAPSAAKAAPAKATAAKAAATKAQAPPARRPPDRLPPLGYFLGGYVLTGRHPSGQPYTGLAQINEDGDTLRVLREIDGARSVWRARFEPAHPAEDLWQFTLRPDQPDGAQRASAIRCFFQSDFDNYPRLSCLQAPTEEATDPRLEAWFHLASWPDDAPSAQKLRATFPTP